MESSWLEQVGVLVVELHLALLEDLGLMWNGICGLTNFLEILVFLLKLGIHSHEMSHLLLRMLGVLLLVVLNIILGALAGLLRTDHIRSVLHVATRCWNLLVRHLKNMLFLVTHFVDDELLVFLNLMEYLGTTLLHVKRTSLVLVRDLVLRVVLVSLVILWRLMHILVSRHEIRFISDVVLCGLLNYLRGSRWTHILVRIFLQTLEGRI